MISFCFPVLISLYFLPLVSNMQPANYFLLLSESSLPGWHCKGRTFLLSFAVHSCDHSDIPCPRHGISPDVSRSSRKAPAPVPAPCSPRDLGRGLVAPQCVQSLWLV